MTFMQLTLPGDHSAANGIPGWVPQDVRRYLSHVEEGRSIRALARLADCHASTILRQIRRLETRRDDPLVDDALRLLGSLSRMTMPPQKDTAFMKHPAAPIVPDDTTLMREAHRIMRRLCETGAVLAVAAEMEKAVVVRDGASGASTRTAVVDRAIAQAMALKGWIASAAVGRITRYQITSAGRSALQEMMGGAGQKDRAGFAEAQTPFDTHRSDAAATESATESRSGSNRARYNLAESPLSALARRRDKDGTRFLSDKLVQAGERLREDFELAQIGEKTTQNWDRFLTPGRTSGPTSGGGSAASAARARVADALKDLGPGLSDVVLRCCCYLEGLETTEKRLGWSARSGKIVLRIALMRLRKHYDDTVGPGGPLIG